MVYELHRAWLCPLGVHARVLAQSGHRTRSPAGSDLRSSLADTLEHAGAAARHMAALIAVPFFTLARPGVRIERLEQRDRPDHGDSLIGDVCVMHAVNRASLAEKRRAGYYR